MGASPVMQVTFHGVRGSTPCHGPLTAKYGGNTACVSIQADGQRPILLDLGTGLRYFGQKYTATTSQPLDAVALVTHMHWDHIQGLPFFSPIIRDGARLEIYGPRQDNGRTFFDAVTSAIRQPTFPVELHDLRGKFEFRDVENDSFMVDDFHVISRSVPHNGPTVGYRIEIGGKSIAYISDHQQPLDGSFALPDGVRELAEDVDLLIHDSQYTAEEFALKSNWGHCTAEFATQIAVACRAKSIALFHHDPDRTDAELDATPLCSSSMGTRVFIAQEGATVSI
jgi:phosphoribosyl 1,2-cyclic phosphodiesterase